MGHMTDGSRQASTMFRQLVTLQLCLSCVAAMPSIPDVLNANNASQLLAVATQQNDTRFLGGSPDGPYTLLVPVDSAFTKLGPAELNNLQTTPGLLDEVLGVHVLRGELFSWDMVNGRVIVSDNGHFVRVYNRNGATYMNDAKEGTIYEVLRKPEFGLTA